MASFAALPAERFAFVRARNGLLLAPMENPWTKQWGLGEKCGEGGQGETFFVPDRSTPKGVLKVLKGSNQNDAKARRRLFQEVNNLRIMSDAGANVPRVLDSNCDNFVREGALLYFVMEYISGQTLAQLVASNPNLLLEIAVNIALALCQTLRIAIQEEIVHRDLKPENVMVRSLDPIDVVMLDFGISFRPTEETPVTEHGEQFQNSLIRLPERTGIAENKRDPRSDLTDVAALLFYCLTAEPPRNLQDSTGKAPHWSVQQRLKEKIPNVIQLKKLNTFFEKGFSQEIDNRFQTIDQLEPRLNELLDSAAFGKSEDLETILGTACRNLRKHDRKTKIAEFRRKLEKAIPEFEKRVRDLQNIIHGSGQFQLWTVDPSARHNSNQRFDDIYRYEYRLQNPVHFVEALIVYEFRLEENECVVYRFISQPSSAPQVSETSEQIKARYDEVAEIDLGELLPDLEASVAECIELITKAIMSSSKSIFE
jgi:serine/threonine protein kinase